MSLCVPLLRKKRAHMGKSRLFPLLFEHEQHLIDDHLLDSLSIISLVAELEDTFDITVPAVEIIPANFNSAEAMMEMIQRLQED